MANVGVSNGIVTTRVGTIAVIYAGDYLNKPSGERIERECRIHFSSGSQSLVINFRETKIVNSIGISILIGIIEASKEAGSTLVFSEVNQQTLSLFDMLGITKHVKLARTEQEALSIVD